MKFNFFFTRKRTFDLLFDYFFHLGITPDCDCIAPGAGIGSWRGCYIDPHGAPPRGYKCNCLNIDWYGCFGRVEKCDSPNAVGCSGCIEKECCSDAGYGMEPGDCNGYD